jgi:manganese-dependent inorganic pyrophosphatase
MGRPVRPTYVTGHKNPDTDSIGSAIAYAEYCTRVDPAREYVAVRLGAVNPQTRWVLEQAQLREPDLLDHINLRVSDVMQRQFYAASVDEAVREVGLTMAAERLDLVPILEHDRSLAGAVTERELARRYIRESRDPSSLVETPTKVESIASAVGGSIIRGAGTTVAGRVWVFAMNADRNESGMTEGDIVVVGDREKAQLKAIKRGASMLVLSNGTKPTGATVAAAEDAEVALITSPLDSYICGRMTTLAAPVKALMDRHPFTVRPEDLVTEVNELIKDVHYRSAVVIDQKGYPVGLITRSDLVNPEPRQVILVDHAEQAQSVDGIEEAHIVEILDHHHIGSIETQVPVRASFDPVGSTATLITERFRTSGIEPSKSAATMMLGAVLSDTVILNSPTTTDRDQVAIDYLEQLVGVDHETFGREMFEAGSDVAGADAAMLVLRDCKEYEVSQGSLTIAQVETVGATLSGRLQELRAALEAERRRGGHVLSALMVTDILTKHTNLVVVGDEHGAERAFGQPVVDGIVELPGVMSRKKQVAPPLLGSI